MVQYRRFPTLVKSPCLGVCLRCRPSPSLLCFALRCAGLPPAQALRLVPGRFEPKDSRVPFTSLKLHPNLLKGIKELGFVRPTPIQADAVPPALAGRDVLACAMTGSGKTAAFLLPIVHRLIDKPRGTTRALVLTPTRELAAPILEDLNDLAVHTPIT